MGQSMIWSRTVYDRKKVCIGVTWDILGMSPKDRFIAVRVEKVCGD